MQRPRYIMIGGFLGAGKTTSIQAFAAHLDAQGLRVGLITNDQGAGLVDSAIGRSKQFPVEEISGGCFCCKFDSLVDAARHLGADSTLRPDVFLAEPVGSCTDLVATVGLPLQAIYGDDFAVAPLSVLVDPVRALRVFQLEDGRGFSENVSYIYKKQLEEAGSIAINKVDLVSAAQLAELREFFAAEFPDAEIFEISARRGDGLEAWFESMLVGEMDAAKVLDIDYDIYADGEALLGWLNATVRVVADEDEIDGNGLLLALAGSLRAAMAERGYEVAHLKATLSPEDAPSEIAAVNLVRAEVEPELSHRLVEPVEEAVLLLNIRAEAPPEALEAAARAALAAVDGARIITERLEHFRPGRPQPTHRYT